MEGGQGQLREVDLLLDVQLACAGDIRVSLIRSKDLSVESAIMVSTSDI